MTQLPVPARLVHAALTALCLIAAPQVRAAGIETTITPAMAEMGCTLRLSGPLEQDDNWRLRRALERVPVPAPVDAKGDARNFAALGAQGQPLPVHRLCLNSAGGPFGAVQSLVTLMHLRGGMPTAVARGDTCAGTCALVFLAGQTPGEGAPAGNALLNPLGALDLAGLFGEGPDRLRNAALVVGMIADGMVVMDLNALAEAMHLPEGLAFPIAQVEDAVALRIEVEPNPLHLGTRPGDDAELAEALCAHAIDRLPPRLALTLQRAEGGGMRDIPTGQRLTCTPDTGHADALLRNFENLGGAGPRRQLRGACAVVVRFEAAQPCSGAACAFGAEVSLPCLAMYQPRTNLARLAVPLPGN